MVPQKDSLVIQTATIDSHAVLAAVKSTDGQQVACMAAWLSYVAFVSLKTTYRSTFSLRSPVYWLLSAVLTDYCPCTVSCWCPKWMTETCHSELSSSSSLDLAIVYQQPSASWAGKKPHCKCSKGWFKALSDFFYYYYFLCVCVYI